MARAKMKELTLTGFLGVAMIAFAAGCAPAHEDAVDSTNASAEDLVTRETFDKAFAIVQGVDYLPFKYKVDGCYARALYMSMELAAKNMESNAVFAFAQPGTALQVGSVEWGYHVAPMLEVGTTAESAVHMVIDPALSNAPLTEAQWVQKMTGPETTVAPTMLFVPGSDYAPFEAQSDVDHQNFDTPSFDAMPPFKASDIQSACGVMFNYLTLETDTDADTVARKQQTLLARTPALVAALTEAGKLTADVQFSADACASSAANQ
jgi:hypothetical protein